MKSISLTLLSIFLVFSLLTYVMADDGSSLTQTISQTADKISKSAGETYEKAKKGAQDAASSARDSFSKGVDKLNESGKEALDKLKKLMPGKKWTFFTHSIPNIFWRNSKVTLVLFLFFPLHQVQIIALMFIRKQLYKLQAIVFVTKGVNCLSVFIHSILINVSECNANFKS